MGEIYKIFAKVMTNRLHIVLHSIIHNAKLYGFLAKRDILHNILKGKVPGYPWKFAYLSECP